jgi:hypothetical protein
MLLDFRDHSRPTLACRERFCPYRFSSSLPMRISTATLLLMLPELASRTACSALAAAVIAASTFTGASHAGEAQHKSPARLETNAAGLASRYPGDVGIDQDEQVLFAEDFETGSLADLSKRWSDVSNKDGEPMAFSGDVPAVSAGTRSLEITATLGKNTGGHLYKRLPRGVERLYARFYVRFAEDAGYTHHFVAIGGYNPPTNWPQGGAGERPRGDDRIYIGIEPNGGYGSIDPPGAWSFYNYWQDMKISADGKYWGNAITPETPLQVPRGRWQCVEIMAKLNTLPDKADGEIALWLDGKPVMHVEKGTPRTLWSGMGFKVPLAGGEPFEGFRWRSNDQLKLNFFWLLDYVTEQAARSNGAAAQAPVHRVWFDDIVVATSYIGPIRSKPH